MAAKPFTGLPGRAGPRMRQGARPTTRPPWTRTRFLERRRTTRRTSRNRVLLGMPAVRTSPRPCDENPLADLP